jgi:hypothetical protein
MTKTAQDSEEPEDPRMAAYQAIQDNLTTLGNMSSLAIARQLLDAATSKLSNTEKDVIRQIQLASIYANVAQAEILGKSIDNLSEAIFKKSLDEEKTE